MKAFVKNLENVPEQYRDLYKQVEGGWLLQVESSEGYALENVTGLKNTILTKNQEIQKLKDKAAENADLDIEQLKKDSAKWQEIKDLDPDEQAAKKVRQAIKTRDEEHSRVIAKRDEREGKLMDKLKSTGLESIKTAIAKAGGRPEWAMDYLKKAVKIELNDDLEVVTTFVEEDGVTPMVDFENGREISVGVDRFVEKMQNSDTYGGIFKTPASGGNGGQSNYDGGDHSTVKKISADQANSHIEELAKGEAVVED